MRRIDLANIQTASSETARDINRNLALNLIRTSQPVSRADLARISGLQRSTISLIVDQLIREKWVVEGARGRLPRGRRPTFLWLNEQRAIIVADVHPKLTKIAVADVNGNLQSQDAITIAEDPKEGVRQIIEAIRQLKKRNPQRIFEGVGISVPGGVDDSQQLIFAPNLKWSNYNIRSAIQRGTGLHVEIENAANTCALGEMWFGQVNGARHMAVVAVAEGIGVGIISNGQLLRGMSGLAGEFGHAPLHPDGPRCQCGAHGCWEMFASESAAERYYREARKRAPAVPFEKILLLADSGDPTALEALRKMAVHLGQGLRTLVAAYSPELIMISGEITSQWHRFGSIIESAVLENTLAGPAPKLIPSRDGSLSRLRGGVALVLQRHSSLNNKH
ncbi:MAG: ROK family protein [Acidobacteria bacterium]|nr:ROK family protein [Acidobacteriota bacterium]